MGLVDTLIVGPGSYKKLRPRIASCSPQTLFKSVHWVAEESSVPGALFYAPQFGAHKSWTPPRTHMVNIYATYGALLLGGLFASMYDLSCLLYNISEHLIG